MHFLPTRRAAHPFRGVYSSPSAVTYTTVKLLACGGSERQQGDEQALRALAEAVHINPELGESQEEK